MQIMKQWKTLIHSLVPKKNTNFGFVDLFWTFIFYFLLNPTSEPFGSIINCFYFMTRNHIFLFLCLHTHIYFKLNISMRHCSNSGFCYLSLKNTMFCSYRQVSNWPIAVTIYGFGLMLWWTHFVKH